MNGTGLRGGKLLPFDAAKLHRQLLDSLRRADLPTEIPALPVDPKLAPAGASSTATPATSSAAARSAPAFAAPVHAPKHTVLTVALADVEGANAGGYVHTMALGQPVERALRWIVDAPGSGGAIKLRLCDGLRGRRTLKPRAGCSMGGRTFESKRRRECTFFQGFCVLAPQNSLFFWPAGAHHRAINQRVRAVDGSKTANR
jgi:hypothetical protein